MPSIHCRGLTHAHTTALPVLTDVTLDLTSPSQRGSWVGVVGANGAGKSTLLRLVAGKLAPTVGSVVVHADGPVVLVPQGVDLPGNDVLAFAATWDGHAERLRARLALDPDDLASDDLDDGHLDDGAAGRRWEALSPGQRRRWQIATALHARPDVLLLDEPTNHLDAEAREVVVAALTGFRGLGLVVSHDREVLDRLTDRTLRLVDGDATLHAGAYGEAAARWRDEEDRRRRGHASARREAGRQRTVLAEVRHDRHSAEAAPRRERRLAGANQPDAREAGRKAAQRKAEAALAARVRQMNTRVTRAEADAADLAVGRDHRGAVAFAHSGSGRRVLAEVTGDVRHGGGEVWLHDVDVALCRGDRVHLAGINGAGKTTLLRALLDALSTTGEVVAALPQELEDPDRVTARLHALAPALRGRVLGVAARLGVDPDRALVSTRPSPGEARKLVLAELLAGAASVVVLDEPTNHLDLPAIERLQEALESYEGALLLVTHDDQLARRVATTRWSVADGRVVVEASATTDDGGQR